MVTISYKTWQMHHIIKITTTNNWCSVFCILKKKSPIVRINDIPSTIPFKVSEEKERDNGKDNWMVKDVNIAFRLLHYAGSRLILWW